MQPNSDFRTDLLRRDGPGFSVAVPADGYAWWYLDALSDDGREALTLIAFVGSVFSPYYAAARRRGPTSPANHCAMNVVLHTAKRTLWTMTERGSRTLERSPSSLRVGPSAVEWDGESFRFDIDEVCVPWPRRLAGTVRYTPGGGGAGRHVLDAAGRHEWLPLAPQGRVEVDFGAQGVRWSGSGYLDSNRGSEPLESGFRRWHWSRWPTPGGAVLLYDAELRDGGTTRLALRVGSDGTAEPVVAPPPADGPRSAWGIRRELRADAGFRPALVRSLVDAPFYTRAVMSSRVASRDVTGVHESLCLDRFSSPVVQAMLAFRMPRVAG